MKLLIYLERSKFQVRFSFIDVFIFREAKVFDPLALSPDGCNVHGWARLNPGSHSFILLSLLGAGPRGCGTAGSWVRRGEARTQWSAGLAAQVYPDIVQSFITLECVASAWEYLLSSEGDVGMGVVEDSLSSR